MDHTDRVAQLFEEVMQLQKFHAFFKDSRKDYIDDFTRDSGE